MAKKPRRWVFSKTEYPTVMFERRLICGRETAREALRVLLGGTLPPDLIEKDSRGQWIFVERRPRGDLVRREGR